MNKKINISIVGTGLMGLQHIKAILKSKKANLHNKKLRDCRLHFGDVKSNRNLETTLLIEPDNEEAILMLMKIALEKSNYSKVKDLSNTFTKVCKKLCDDNKDVLETLANIEPKNDS